MLMKNKFQSFVGMRLGGCRLIDTLITHKSPTNHPLKSRTWKVMAMMVLAFVLGIGQMWAADITVIPTIGQNVNTLPYGLFTITHSSTKGDSKISSGAIAANSKNDVITINFKTTKSDMYIKSVTFNTLSNGALSSTDGTISSNTFTVSGNNNDVNVVLTSNNNAKGSVKITNVVVNTGDNDVETITFNSFDGTNKTFGFTSSAGASTAIKSISSNNSNSVSSNILSWSNNRTLVFAASGKIKYAAFVANDGKVYTGFSADEGTYKDDYSWTGDVETLTLTNGTGGGRYIKNFYVIVAPAAKHTLTWNFDGGSTTSTSYTAGGQVAEGATITYPAAETMSRSGKDFNGWSTSVTTMPTTDLTITAQWVDHVAKYTVKYMDGTTVLGTEEVNVGSTPAGLANDPTKDCYTFAAWSPALNTVSGDENDVVEVSATWTPNYFTESVDFEEDGSSAVSGIASKNIVASNAGSYDGGKAEENWAYKGWKIKSAGATVKVLVKAGKQLTFKFGYLAATAHVAITGDATNYSVTGASNVEDDPLKYTTYSWIKDYDALYTFTTGDKNAAVIKAIYVNDVYNVTYTDETGDASGVASNVAEVTLPTPTETTVGTSTFTGWTANKIVYDGETAKAVGAALEAGKTYKLTDNTVFTAQWAAVTDFDVKFFQGYGEPDAQIGTTQVISTGNYATAPADPSREGYNFKGWSYDATEEHIVNVDEYAITAATNFTAIWKQVFAVTFDGAGEVNVESGSKVASPNSPSQAGKVFLGWYNGEDKWNFADNVTAAMALISKWEDANANHFYYNYKDAFHYDGFAYKTPEGKVDEGAGASNIAITTPYTLFSGAAGITSIVATKAIYDSKSNWVNAYLKINTSEDSYLTFTIASGYTAVLKMKMGGYSSNPTVTLKKGEDVIAATSGTIGGVASTENNYNEITYNLVAGTYTMTTATKTLYISHIDLEATALPTFTVSYYPGDGSGDVVVAYDATQVLDGSTMFTAPEGQVFNGWKDGDNNDVAVGAIVENDMTLYAQWINQYAVTFDMQGHGTAIAPQYIKHGAKATKPADPFVMGWDFGGWFTEATCENEFDFNTAIEATTPLFAKWTEFTGCTMLYPAKNGDAIAVGDPIVMQDGSFGGAMSALAIPDGGSLTYTNYGLAFTDKSGVKANVVLNNDIVAGTKIALTLVAGGTKTRGLFLYTKDGAKINDFTCWVDGVNPASNGLEDTFTYTVQTGDGLEGTNEFQLWRNNTVYLKSVKVSSCGDAIIYHDLTSEVNIAGKGTVTLGANSVREGYTTTATYSDIDPLYEFVSWSVSGEGASIESATANPAIITMGTEDAVVTLNLQVKPVKFTVNYYDGTTLMGSEEVNANEHPTAAGIETAKAHYIFEGWAESATATASDVIDLATITSDVAATFTLYAVYTAIPCVSEGTVFSMSITDPEGTEYNENNTFGVEIGATYVGGKAYSGSKSTTKRIGYIDANGEYAFANNGDVTIKIAMDCALQEGDVIVFTNSNNRQLKIQKVAGTDLYTTANKKFTIPAASPLIGEYDFYLERGNTASTMKTLRVERPYTVSFDLQGHGDAIDAVKQINGEKIAAPTAPTADGWDFGGWYKEAACTNAWDFDNDVVESTMSLFAKWTEHVTNDATLKSLKYGNEAIALEDGVYAYDVELPALTTTVPALSAETNATLATKSITDADAFDGDGKATSTVVVTAEDGATQLTYTVNFAKAAAVALQDVTGSITWNFANAVSGTVNITGTPQVLANYAGVTNDATFESDKLEASGEKFTAGSKANLRANYIRFHTTVPGKISISYSNTGGNAARFIYVNGVKYDEDGSANTTPKGIDTKVFVPAGDVELVMKDGEDVSKNVQIYQIIFDITHDHLRPVNPAYLGTLCWTNNAALVGATLYELAGKNENNYLVFDEVAENRLEAGKPYIFMPENGNTEIKLYNTDNEAALTEDQDPVNNMYGTLTGKILVPGQDDNMYYFSASHIWAVKDFVVNINVPAYYCYVDYVAVLAGDPAPAPAQGRRRVTMGTQGSQVATGMDAIKASDKPMKLLINGQIFILCGEKMYDATGRLVK